MKDSEKVGFVNGLKVMREMWELQELSPAAIDQYWECLKSFSSDQFVKACRSLMERSKTSFGKTFPLPGDFIAWMAPDPKEYAPIGIADIPGRTGRILGQLIALMPARGHFNTDAEAEAMVQKMERIVDKEFEDDPPSPYNCDGCGDTGLLHCWFQFHAGFRQILGGEVAVNRVPNSPYWVTQCGEASPFPELRLTPCIARCDCRAGAHRDKSIPLYNSFQKIAGQQDEGQRSLKLEVGNHA